MILGVGAGRTTVSAQSAIAYGQDRPPDTLWQKWFQDTVQHLAWYRFDYPTWRSVRSGSHGSITACGEFVILDLTENAGRILLYTADGLQMHGGRHCDCLDSLVIFTTESQRWFYHPRTKEFLGIGLAGKDGTPTKPALAHDTLGGIPVYCAAPLPWNLGLNRKFAHKAVYEQIRAWGMVGANAQWVLEPRFDVPFHFKNGIAEVRYYGQRRKINEKGEFVE